MHLILKDIGLQVSESLTNQEKIRFSMTSTYFNKLKYQFIYQNKINMARIRKLSYFNNFEFVEINDIMQEVGYANILPKNVKFICFSTGKTKIPQYVTHLTFIDKFNQSIANCIPNSVTCITFGHSFNQSIANCIPNSVTCLTFGHSFNQSIANCIPNSVTRLTFGHSFNQSIANCIPNSVTHLTFGCSFNQSTTNCIPNSVTHLTFGNQFFNGYPFGDVLKSVTHLTISNTCINMSWCMPFLTHLTINVHHAFVSLDKKSPHQSLI
uniref:F-box and FNIP repeat-containing protein n=1 Tax=viral metagenome TaxID=1070528 RepID=A0A6C0CD03_9ZZZZ